MMELLNLIKSCMIEMPIESKEESPDRTRLSVLLDKDYYNDSIHLVRLDEDVWQMISIKNRFDCITFTGVYRIDFYFQIMQNHIEFIQQHKSDLDENGKLGYFTKVIYDGYSKKI